MLTESIVDAIQSFDTPYYSWQKWACHCGETKTNMKKHKGLAGLLKKQEEDK